MQKKRMLSVLAVMLVCVSHYPDAKRMLEHRKTMR